MLEIEIRAKGPPASGKTRLIEEIAKLYNGEIVSHEEEIGGGEEIAVIVINGAN